MSTSRLKPKTPKKLVKRSVESSEEIAKKASSTIRYLIKEFRLDVSMFKNAAFLTEIANILDYVQSTKQLSPIIITVMASFIKNDGDRKEFLAGAYGTVTNSIVNTVGNYASRTVRLIS
jgi:hypothetical protein